VSQRDDERLLDDPSFIDPVSPEEQGVVNDLIARHGADKIAAAFVRVFRSGRSAPEELTEIVQAEARSAPKDRPDFAVGPSGPREDFGEGIWFSLSIGRNQQAEPRWLIPMLCRAGNITKREIGAIRMQQTETFVQIAAGVADEFADAIGPKRMLERGVRIRKLDGAPVANHRPSHGGAKRFADKQPAEGAAAPSEHAPRPENAPRDKKPWGKPSFKDKPSFKEKSSFKDKPSFGNKPPYKDKPSFKDGPASPAGAKPKKRKPRD
jgi:ATP-dependent RNA helicase DeaD